MAFRKRNPGCPCCCDLCDLHDTDFAAEADLTDYFTIWEGGASPSNVTWTTGTVKIDANPTTFVRVMSDTLHPLVPYAPRVRMQVKGAEGARLRVLLSWSENSDSSSAVYSDGLIAELRPTATCAEMYLIQVQSGVEYIREGPIPVPKATENLWHTIEACYDPDTLTLSAIVTPYGQDENTQASVVLSSHTDGEYVGFGAPSTSTADTYFDDWDFDILWYCQGTATIETYQEGSSSSGGATNEIQTLTIDAVRGTYRLSFDGAQTGEIAYDADAATIETALEGLPDIGTGNVTVTGTNPFTITFTGSLAGTDVDEIGTDQSCLQDDQEYGITCSKVWCHDCHGNQCAWAVGHFDHADNKTCEWEGDVTDWTVDVANEHIETTATSTILLHKSEYPWDDRTSPVAGDNGESISDHYHAHRLLTKFRVTADGREILIIVAAEDTDNYIAARVTIGADDECGTVELISVETGVETAISKIHTIHDIIPDTWYWGQLSFVDGLVDFQIGTIVLTTWAEGYAYPVGIPGETDGWVRQFRADSTGQTYHGPHVGFGAGSGSGEVNLSYFKAGCSVFYEKCELEHDEFSYNSGGWQDCNWNLISGGAPSRSGTGLSAKLVFSSSAIMLLKNPVPGDTLDEMMALAAFEGIDSTNDKAAVIIGSDATATDYLKVEAYEDASSPYDKLAMYRVNSGMPTLLGTAVAAPRGTGGTDTISACLKDYSGTDYLTGSGLSGILKAQAASAYGPYCGLDVSPASGNISVGQFKTNRCPTCDFAATCADYCIDDLWPFEMLLEIENVFSPASPPTPFVSTCTGASCAGLSCSDYNLDAYLPKAITPCRHTSTIKLCCEGGGWPYSTGELAGWINATILLQPHADELTLEARILIYATDGTGGINNIQTVIFRSAGLSDWVSWDPSRQDPVSCMTFNRVPLNFVSDSGTFCQVNAAGKMYVTSIP